jgi:hypothetical protein
LHITMCVVGGVVNFETSTKCEKKNVESLKFQKQYV